MRLSGRGYEIETEMLIKLASRGARIARVPIGVHYHGVSEQASTDPRHDQDLLSGGPLSVLPRAISMSDDRLAAGPRWHPRGLNNGAIFSATYYGVSRLPQWLTYGIGHVGTWLAYHLLREGTTALVENLSVMFPDLNQRQLNALALRTYRSYARDVIDFIRSLRLTQEATRQLVTDSIPRRCNRRWPKGAAPSSCRVTSATGRLAAS